MTLRHAAPLALLGWYLMIPPIDCGKHIAGENILELGDPKCVVEATAPLSRWIRAKATDSAAECEALSQGLQDRMDLRQHHLEGPPPLGSELSKSDAKLSALWNTKCVATDDPALRGN